MVVTAIRQTSSDRLIVTLDEAEEIKTTLGVVTEHRLYNGAELDDAAAEALRRDSARALAREAIDIPGGLRRRPRHDAAILVLGVTVRTKETVRTAKPQHFVGAERHSIIVCKENRVADGQVVVRVDDLRKTVVNHLAVFFLHFCLPTQKFRFVTSFRTHFNAVFRVS